ncbi:MAG TPA: Nramp family divalent metal transporter [Thermoanaerobaculia bacterium]|jgi:manganese transport protein|nr:Nramp family divalent metal transporter [Thermoanaerobaculia bacterium]
MKTADLAPSLPEVHRSVPIPYAGTWLRRLFAFAGPAYLVSVGYMDPGNWATDLAGGARFGYQLVWVLLMSNLMAMLLQTLAARLGVATGKDLAQACRDWYPRQLVVPLWLLCEVAIIACDLAEVLGAAIGLKLLFGVPLLIGVLLTALDVLLLLAMSRLGMRRLEAFILSLVATIGACFAVEMLLSRPDIAAIFTHFIPRGPDGAVSLFSRHGGLAGGITVLGLRGDSLYIAMGIIGATVMPHNLYLHSSLVQSRAVSHSVEGKRQAMRMNLVDTIVALNAALFVNGAILVLAAAVFHTSGHHDVAKLEEAYQLLTPLLGTSFAATVFAVALLASGQASTVTGTLAGQIVMEGFLHIRIRPWLRRLISRSLAIIPAVLFIAYRGEGAVDDLLIFSQVVLSVQLAYAVIPLITFTSDRKKMGDFVSPRWVIALACLTAVVIVALNAKLVVDSYITWRTTAGPVAWWVWALAVPVTGLLGLILLYCILEPFVARLRPVVRRAEPVSVTGEWPVSAKRAVAENVPYKRVALALELGRADQAVIDHVRTMPLPAKAEVLLLHVAESAASRYLGAESRDQEAREDQVALDALAAELQAHGLKTRVLLGYGEVKSELARLVNASGVDLLITGAHGHRWLGDLVFGATVSSLRHMVRCPVLSVRGNGKKGKTATKDR